MKVIVDLWLSLEHWSPVIATLIREKEWCAGERPKSDKRGGKTIGNTFCCCVFIMDVFGVCFFFFGKPGFPCAWLADVILVLCFIIYTKSYMDSHPVGSINLVHVAVIFIFENVVSLLVERLRISLDKLIFLSSYFPSQRKKFMLKSLFCLYDAPTGRSFVHNG